MSIDIYVTAPPGSGLPDPKEPISSFANAPGNIMTATQVIGYGQLRDLADSIPALKELITELDKGPDGKFSDQWCVDADLRWSDGKEMREAWKQIAPYVPRTGRTHRSRPTGATALVNGSAKTQCASCCTISPDTK